MILFYQTNPYLVGKHTNPRKRAIHICNHMFREVNSLADAITKLNKVWISIPLVIDKYDDFFWDFCCICKKVPKDAYLVRWYKFLVYQYYILFYQKKTPVTILQ